MATTASPTVTPLEGKTSIDDKMTFGPQRLSYASANNIAPRIVGQVADLVKSQTVVIAGTALLADFANLQSFTLPLEVFSVITIPLLLTPKVCTSGGPKRKPN